MNETSWCDRIDISAGSGKVEEEVLAPGRFGWILDETKL